MFQVKFRNLVVTWDVIVWMLNWSDSTDYRFFNYSSWIYFDLNSSRINWGTCSAGTDYEFEVWNNYVKNVWASSNILSWSTVSWYTWSTTIKLNYNQSSWAISSNRFYYLKIYESSTLVRNFIPVVYDWEAWLWDLVENKFYWNSWSWSFTYA